MFIWPQLHRFRNLRFTWLWPTYLDEAAWKKLINWRDAYEKCEQKSPGQPQNKLKVNAKVRAHQCQIAPSIIVRAKVEFMETTVEVTIVKKINNKKSETRICRTACWQFTKLLGNCPVDRQDKSGTYVTGHTSSVFTDAKMKRNKKRTLSLLRRRLWTQTNLGSCAAFLHLLQGFLNLFSSTRWWRCSWSVQIYVSIRRLPFIQVNYHQLSSL